MLFWKVKTLNIFSNVDIVTLEYNTLTRNFFDSAKSHPPSPAVYSNCLE
eukprot:UN08338